MKLQDVILKAMAKKLTWIGRVFLAIALTADVDTGKRIPKFLRYGATGCRGAGSPAVGGALVAKQYT